MDYRLLHGFGVGAISMGLIFSILLLAGQAEVIGVNQGKLVSWIIPVNLMSVGVTAFSEEMLMRGFIMTALKTTRIKWLIFALPAVLFSFAHLLNPDPTILSLTNTFIAGLLFGYIFVKSGKLWLPAGFHIAWNFFQGDIFGMNVTGNEQASLLLTKLRTNEMLSGGAVGHE